MAFWCIVVVMASAGVSIAASEPVTILSIPESNHSIADVGMWMDRLYSIRLTDEGLHCAKSGKVLYRHSDGHSDCYYLYQKGPCSSKQWLVMERRENKNSLQPVCRPRPCAPGYDYVVEKNTCIPQNELCPRGMIFQYSLLGEGRCHCIGFRATGDDGNCYVLYGQGFCPKGEILVPSYDLYSPFDVTCEPNPCPENHLNIEKFSGRKVCEPLFTLDCTPEALPLFSNIDVKVPQCVYSPRNVGTVPSRPSDCVLSNSGSCAKVVIRSVQPFDWFPDEDFEARSSASSFRKRHVPIFSYFTF